MDNIPTEVEAWVISYFSSEFHIPPERVAQAEDSKLSDWGYADERALAFLAGNFNQAARTRPAWNNAHVTPPELIAGVQGDTLGGLIMFLISVVEANL